MVIRGEDYFHGSVLHPSARSPFLVVWCARCVGKWCAWSGLMAPSPAVGPGWDLCPLQKPGVCRGHIQLRAPAASRCCMSKSNALLKLGREMVVGHQLSWHWGSCKKGSKTQSHLGDCMEFAAQRFTHLCALYAKCIDQPLPLSTATVNQLLSKKRSFIIKLKY